MEFDYNNPINHRLARDDEFGRIRDRLVRDEDKDVVVDVLVTQNIHHETMYAPVYDSRDDVDNSQDGAA